MLYCADRYGITRVMEGGDLLEKAAVNVSIVRGHLSESRAKAGTYENPNETRLQKKRVNISAFVMELTSKETWIESSMCSWIVGITQWHRGCRDTAGISAVYQMNLPCRW